MFIETIFALTHNVAVLFGFTLNLYLLFLAFFKTPKSMKTYSLLVINFAVADLFACFTDFMTEDRVIPAKETIAYISFGPCRQAGPYTCWVLFSLLLTCLTHSLFSLLYSFYYRYRILFVNSPSQTRVFISLLLIMVPSVCQTFGYIMSYADPESVRRKIEHEFPAYNLTGLTITGFKDLNNFIAWIPILNCVLLLPCVYIGIVFFRHKIIRFLKEHSAGMSVESRRIHSQLLLVLTYQSFVPGCMLMGMGLFALGMVGIHGETIEYCTMIFNVLMPVLSPLSYICFLGPYKKFTLSLFNRVNNRTVPRENIVPMSNITRTQSGICPTEIYISFH